MKVVITDHRFPDIQQEQKAVDQVGGTLVVAQTTDEKQLADACRDADGVVNSRAQVTRTVIAAMERCRIIVRYGIGVDTIDVAAATERGILVANVPDYCIDEVSDHALTLLLTMSRQLIAAIRLAKQDTWAISKMPQLHRLRGQTCGLLGCGKIGSLLAGKVSALGMRVIVRDPYLSEENARRINAEIVSFGALLERSDFISLHAPLTEQTRNIFGKEAFSKMKKTAYLINAARGGLIDEAALIEALDSGVIDGAGLDVLESETNVTPVRSSLVTHPKVVVTPHTSWLSIEARAALQARAIEQVLTCLKGGMPYGLVNREVVRS